MGEIMTERRRGSFSVLAIPWVVAARVAVSSEFRNERFNGREEGRGNSDTGSDISAAASRFVQFAIFEVSGVMRATQRVAEVTWTGSGGGGGGGGAGGKGDASAMRGEG